MYIIKKLFIILTVIIIIIITTLSLLILSSKEGYLDKPVHKLITYYLNKKGFKIQIKDLRIRNNTLSIDKLSMDLPGEIIGDVSNINIAFSLADIITNPLLRAIIDIDNFSLVSKNNQQLISAKISNSYIIDFFNNSINNQLNLSDIKNITMLDSYGEKLPDGTGICFYNDTITSLLSHSKKSINCQLTFNKKTYLVFNSILDGNTIQINSDVHNIPIMVYQIVGQFIPDNPIILFLHEYIKDGYIRSGEFNIATNLSKDYTILSNSILKANMHVLGLEYEYDKDYPALRKVDSNITISGSSVKFILNQAYSSNTIISGNILFDWQGMDKSNFIVNAAAKGEVRDLIDFISNENYNKVKKQGIDLKEIKGVANSKLNIIIPINPDTRNTYDVSTIITEASGKMFNDNVVLSNAKINGKFDGNKISLVGRGKINDYNSNFTYQYNILDNNRADYKQLLNIKTTIIANKQKIGLIKLISGSSILDFEYKEQKNGKNLLNASSNLKNLEFYIDKISIHKKLSDEAKINLTGDLSDKLDGNIDIHLSGEKNLKIVAKVNIHDNKYDITIPQITYNTTDLVAKLLLDKNSLNAKIHGNQLDLSEANMMQFLEKEVDPKNVYLKVDVDKVKLKNNIILDHFNLQIECDKVKCFSGNLNSKIGTKSFKMILLDMQNKERWIVTCDNAGALFKGIGMYTKMKSGIINLTLDTKRHEIKKGEIIPILNGTFDIKRFVTTDVPFLTRMVSVVSFPGFLSFILNNKDIMFTNMNGKFNYIRNAINITDTSATGPFFDFSMKGTIDTSKRDIKLSGNVIPSFFFASNIITKIPIIGQIFSKTVPYSMELKYTE